MRQPLNPYKSPRYGGSRRIQIVAWLRSKWPVGCAIGANMALAIVAVLAYVLWTWVAGLLPPIIGIPQSLPEEYVQPLESACVVVGYFGATLAIGGLLFGNVYVRMWCIVPGFLLIWLSVSSIDVVLRRGLF